MTCKNKYVTFLKTTDFRFLPYQTSVFVQGQVETYTIRAHSSGNITMGPWCMPVLGNLVV